VTAADPRYEKIFSLEREARELGELVGDLSAQMSQLLSNAAVQKGSLRALLGIKQVEGNYSVERPYYTIFSFSGCNAAFRDNLTFSSRWWRKNWIDDVVAKLLDNLNGKVRADLDMELCARLPVNVITPGMGMDGNAALHFRENLIRATFARNAASARDVCRSGSAELSRFNHPNVGIIGMQRAGGPCTGGDDERDYSARLYDRVHRIRACRNCLSGSDRRDGARSCTAPDARQRRLRVLPGPGSDLRERRTLLDWQGQHPDRFTHPGTGQSAGVGSDRTDFAGNRWPSPAV
jgi:hypothetical protein